MSEWKERSIERRDYRATEIEEVKVPHKAKKNTRKYCKGKEGREHIYEIRIAIAPKTFGQVCKNCGRIGQIYWKGIGTETRETEEEYSLRIKELINAESNTGVIQ